MAPGKDEKRARATLAVKIISPYHGIHERGGKLGPKDGDDYALQRQRSKTANGPRNVHTYDWPDTQSSSAAVYPRLTHPRLPPFIQSSYFKSFSSFNSRLPKQHMPAHPLLDTRPIAIESSSWHRSPREA
eukprot:scaffold2329_cov247-Pinguiococcus_pyrenoidosus.AAC.18